MNFTPKPAPLQKRVMAGIIDAAFIIVLGAVSFLVPLLSRGIALPMWGVLAVLIGYSVLPIAFFRKTIGLAIMGLEVVGKTGHPLDLANTLFRELIGRGWFPAAYLFTVILSLIASKLGIGGAIAPAALMGLMTLACAAALATVAVGHLISVERADKRTLGDLLSGSFVVEGRALPLPTDADELEEYTAQRKKVVRNVVVVEVLLVLAVYVSPLVLMAKTGESPQARGQRLKLEALQSKFDKEPGSESLARDLIIGYRNAGRVEEAEAVRTRHREAMSLKEVKREEDLRAQMAQNPSRDNATPLIELLENQDRVDEAREVYLQYLGATPEPGRLAGFANWLAGHGRTDEAVEVLNQVLKQDPLVPYAHTMLGVSLTRLGKFQLAREELELALLDEPDDEDAADALREVEEKVGALSAADKKVLRKRFEAWRSDAGYR